MSRPLRHPALLWPPALVLLALGACSTASLPVAGLPFMEVPKRWQDTTVERPTPLAEWWQRFGDPLLATLVQDALRTNTDIVGALAALRQARAQRNVAQAGLYPVVQGSLNATQGWRDAVPTHSVGAGMDARWELDVFGATRSAVRASDATAGVSAASLGAIQVSVAAEVVLNYISLRSAQERLDIANNNVSLQRSTLQIADWRLQAGLATLLESEQARAALEQTRALLPVLRTARAQAAYGLSVLTGRTPDSLLDALSPAGAVPQPASDIALGIPADTLRQRADVRAAELQVTAATARVAQARAVRWPAFQLSGSIGLDALTLAGLGSGASVLGSALAAVTLPLLDGGGTQAQLASQLAALDLAHAAYKGSVLGALQDVENALVALREDRQRLDSLRLAAAAATTAGQLANDLYQGGLVDFQTVLDTQRTLLATQDGVATAFAAVSADHVRLYKALGGGWQSDLQPQAL